MNILTCAVRRTNKFICLTFLLFFNPLIYAQSPIAYWKLDESIGTVASDSSGRGNNGTLSGCTWLPGGGKINGTLQFNGSSNYVQCGTSVGSSSALTVSFWLKADALKYQIPIDKLPGSGKAGWSIKLRNNGDIWIRIGSEGTHDDLVLTGVYQANTWVQVAFTFLSGKVIAFINGNIAGSLITSYLVSNTTTQLRLGNPSAVNTNNEAYGGLLDDVQIYDRSLGFEEIMAMNGITISSKETGDLVMWYDKPAGAEFTSALPIGNGRLGGMIYGNVEQEKIGLNESTVWSGSPGNNNKTGASGYLADIRNKIFLGNASGACNAANSFIGGGEAAFMPVGNLNLNFTGHSAANYYRELNLKTATAKTTYTFNGVNYTREYFASYPDQSIVVRLTADQPGKISFVASLDCPHGNKSIGVEGNDVLVLKGTAGSIKFQTLVKLSINGGTINADNSTISVNGANSSTVILAIGTNFNMYNDVSGDQDARAVQYISNTENKTYNQILQDHIASYQELFNRVDLNLGNKNNYSNYTTDMRIATFAFSDDPQLVRLYYQFGRYLMISCSRLGSQPANLQGVWNDLMSPPWGSKYTTNINTEMNYWMTETANLPECALPLIDKVKNLVPPGQLTAKVHWGVNSGWVEHHNTDLWNRTAPIDGTWGLWPTGGAWLSKHLWEHYLFNPDKNYLMDVYPVLKGAAEFFLASLVTETMSGNNYLGTCPSASPENLPAPWQCFVSFAPTMDIQIIRDLFNSVIDASKILNIDVDLRTQISEALKSLPPNKIGQSGQLQEWFNDWDNPTDQHRHVSHLYGLFPSNQISLRGTPALTNAAKTTLIQRGDLSTGWSLAWKINLWARLEDGNHSYKLIQMLLSSDRTYKNLFDAHPPFQIDGNFGAVSGINEMLLQSQNNEIQFLPALPDVWVNGSFKGLRARKGFVIDSVSWNNKTLTKATISSTLGDTCRVRSGSNTKQFLTLPGMTYVLDASLTIIDQFNTPVLKPAKTNGLKGKYYNGKNFDSQMMERIDSVISFDWQQGSASPLVHIDNASIQWTGSIEPLFSETYTFYTSSDDGVRLWINNQLIIDNWKSPLKAEDSGSIMLTAGKKYNIKLEYFENIGASHITLAWSSPSQPKQLIPESQLFPLMQPDTTVDIKNYTYADNFDIDMYPNPAGDQLSINSDQILIDKIIISDMQGRIVKTYTFHPSSSVSLDISELTKGVFFVELNTPKKCFTRKLVKI